MMPFIRSRDKVCISPVEKNEIRRGDVLAFVLGEDCHMLIHRVVKISEGSFLCKGDNQAQNLDGWIAYDDVIGKVTEIRREGKAVKLGLGGEKGLIARLSIHNRLPACQRFAPHEMGILIYFLKTLFFSGGHPVVKGIGDSSF